MGRALAPRASRAASFGDGGGGGCPYAMPSSSRPPGAAGRRSWRATTAPADVRNGRAVADRVDEEPLRVFGDGGGGYPYAKPSSSRPPGAAAPRENTRG